MKLNSLISPFASFRTQMITFIVVMLLITGLVITTVNQRLESRTSRMVLLSYQSIITASDIGLRSLAEGEYLYNLVNTRKYGNITVNPDSIIERILVVDVDNNKIVDSTAPYEINTKFSGADRPTLQPGDIKLDADSLSLDQDFTLQYSIETEKDRHYIILIDVTLEQLRNVKAAAQRDRLIAFVVLGLLLIIAIIVFSRRVINPIKELGQAARRVTEGNIDFNVPVAGPAEVSTLTKTFNEMLAGLRSKRELELQLRRAERSAMVGRLASGIAHEIRNPLNFINLSIDHLKEKFAPQSEVPRKEYTNILNTIKDELARLNRLVSEFLSYGRPAKLKLREIDTRSLIEEVRALVSAKSEQQNVKINIMHNGNGTSRVHADAEQLKTCFSNLMINAVQAMPEGGSLDVTVSPNSSSVEIEFSDTGVGIAPEALEQIFEPYYSTKETGIGLGLPLTKKIIEEHGGQISVRSELHQGTTFRVTLPREPN